MPVDTETRKSEIATNMRQCNYAIGKVLNVRLLIHSQTFELEIRISYGRVSRNARELTAIIPDVRRFDGTDFVTVALAHNFGNWPIDYF